MVSQNISENLNIETSKSIESKNNLYVPKNEILKNYKWFEEFARTLYSSYVKEETKKHFIYILEKIDANTLKDYIDFDNNWNIFLTWKEISDFVEAKKTGFPLENEDTIKKQEENAKKDFSSDYINNDNSLTNKWKKEWDNNTAKRYKNEADKYKKTKEYSNNSQNNFEIKLPELEKIFSWNKDISENINKFKILFLNKQLIDKNADKDYTEAIKLIEKNINDVKEIVNNIFDSKEKSVAFFQKIAKENPEIYSSVYESLVWVSPELEANFETWWIPKKAEWFLPVPPEYFPTAKAWDVTKRWDVVSYGDASVDLSTGKAYITSENWYKLESHVEKLDAMPIRIKFQKERLDILEKLDEEKTFQKNAENTLKYIKEEKVFDRQKDLEKDLEAKKNEKKSPRKSANELQLDLEITRIEKELELVNKKIEEIKKAFPKDPNQTEEDYIANIWKFLESKLFNSKENIEKLEKALEENKQNYEKEISSLLEKNWKQVNDSLEATRQTTLLLDSIWFTLIPQHITDDIIATINKNPEYYWFESRIDLKNWNFGWINTIATKERFIKKFNKMISGKEWEPITTEEINNILVKKIEKDKNSQEEKNKELLNNFSKYWIMKDLWTWDREKLESNLTIKEKETPKTEK